MRRFTVHAAEQAKKRYGDWLDLQDVAGLLDRGKVVRQRLAEGEGFRIFDVLVANQPVRVLCQNQNGAWCIVTVLPPEFRIKTHQRANKERRQEYFKRRQREDEEDAA